MLVFTLALCAEGGWFDALFGDSRCEGSCTNGQGVYTFESGETYDGEWKDNQKNGRGVYTDASGNEYIGEWKNNQKNGQGVYTNANGLTTTYDGEWKNNKWNGKGVSTDASGNKYVGEWKDNQKNGRGVHTFESGSTYDGEWKDGQYNGKGIHTGAAGNKYDGEWKDDQKHGKGLSTEGELGNNAHCDVWNGGEKVSSVKQCLGDCKNGEGVFITCADGSKYDGKFKDSKKHGRGMHSFVNGKKYDGQWTNDQKNGKGIYTSTSGDKYDGEFKDNQQNGKGMYTWASGNTYDGDFKNSKQHGEGTFTFASGSKYDGQWEDDKYNGKGVYTKTDGSKYDGEWKNDKYNGKGVHTKTDGSTYDGDFKEGKYNGKGVLTEADGSTFDGEWKYGNKHHGAGTMTSSDGNTHDIEWKSGKQLDQAYVNVCREEGFVLCDEWEAAQKAKRVAADTAQAKAIKQNGIVWQESQSSGRLSKDGRNVHGGSAASNSLKDVLKNSKQLSVSVDLTNLAAGYSKDEYGKPRDVTAFGIECGSTRYLMRLTDCCSPDQTTGTRSCLPAKHCIKDGGTARFRWDDEEGNWDYLVGASSSYSIFKGVCRGVGSPRLVAVLQSSGKLSNLAVVTQEDEWKIHHMKKGADVAAEGGTCAKGYAACGREQQHTFEDSERRFIASTPYEENNDDSDEMKKLAFLRWKMTVSE
jgi:hypothetical protein